MGRVTVNPREAELALDAIECAEEPELEGLRGRLERIAAQDNSVHKMAVIELPRPSPSQNELIALDRARNFSRIAELKREWLMYVRSAINKMQRRRLPCACQQGKAHERCRHKTKPRPAIVGPVALHVGRFGKRALDNGNLIGGAKWIIDMLVLEGLLADDTEAYLYPITGTSTIRSWQPCTELRLTWREEASSDDHAN